MEDEININDYVIVKITDNVKKDDVNNYVYVLYSPMTAQEFLNHPILNVVLYNNLGKKE